MTLFEGRDAAAKGTIKSNDKERARINAMQFFLNQFDYENGGGVTAAERVRQEQVRWAAELIDPCRAETR